MSLYFFDSSGLVKRYVAETGSSWVQAITAPAAGNQLYVARITGAEMIAAITRRLRRGETTPADAARATMTFRNDFAINYFRLDTSDGVIARAMDLAETHGLRGFDAVQLATALGLRDLCRMIGLPDPMMITADRELYAAAVAEGLPADDPNAHP